MESLDVYRNANNNSTGQPRYFAVVDGTLELAPTPDTAYTLQLTYYGKISALSDSNTSNFISTNHPDVYLYGCLKQASIFLMEDERVPMFTAQFEKALEEMRMQQERASFGKGSLIQRSRTYGKPHKQVYFMKN